MTTKFDNPEAQAPANTFDSPPPTNKPGQMTPVTKSGIEGGVKYVVSSMQGWRDKMEDAHNEAVDQSDLSENAQEEATKENKTEEKRYD